MEKSDLHGIFYNEEYLLTVTKGYVQLNTNIETDHKPFFPKILWREKYEYEEKDHLIQISENLAVLPTSDFNFEVILILDLDQHLPMRRFK
ncbi:hypothetical protein IX39_00040 [Chryseobacterium formosense]|uniref:Uncharacterized protein n=1 Tax=Chryseobacterium formosense TaxID=236814 RepID=A0A085Z3W1_9FLAO|nr:hypothetical protein [Chryseobacterium formosense]KFE99124.1 hypothetical protein IX39_00040 [Chryseobacterium formosense]SFT68516.1 hypothetical protein SAMN05421857_2420 [Chryseobacterium formosense]